MWPPNSLAAVKAAVLLEVDLIEIDVRVTGDSDFVVHHDAHIWVDGRPVAIIDLCSDTLREHQPAIPRLVDVLDAVTGSRTGIVIDLKDASHEVEIIDVCEASLGPERFVVTTVEDDSVRRIRDARPHVAVALTLGRDTRGLGMVPTLRIRLSELRPWHRVEACSATMLAVHHQIARLGVLRSARIRAIPVMVWTINDPRMIAKVSGDCRYWAFQTDRPRLAMRQREDDGTC